MQSSDDADSNNDGYMDVDEFVGQHSEDGLSEDGEQ